MRSLRSRFRRLKFLPRFFSISHLSSSIASSRTFTSFAFVMRTSPLPSSKIGRSRTSGSVAMISFITSAVNVDQIQPVSTNDKVGNAKIAVDEAVSVKLSFPSRQHYPLPSASLLRAHRGMIDDVESRRNTIFHCDTDPTTRKTFEGNRFGAHSMS